MLIQNLFADDSGQDLVEYGLIALILGLLAIAALALFVPELKTALGNAAKALH